MPRRMSGGALVAGVLRDGAGLALTVGALAGAVVLLGKVPTCLDPDPGPRLARSALEAEALFGARLLLPAYYPDTLAWPPIYRAGRAPAPWVVMEIRHRDGGAGMALGQALGVEPPEPRPPGAPAATEQVSLGDGTATLERYPRGGDAPLYYLRWRRGDRHLVLAGREGPEMLVRIARTMRARVGTEVR